MAADHSFHVLASNNPPFNYQNEDGVVQGIAIDTLKAIIKESELQITLSEVSVINWARAVHETTSKPLHILLSPARTAKRESQFKWVGPLHPFKMGLIARKDKDIRIESVDDLKKWNIGVIRDSAPIQILKNTYGINPEDMIKLAGDDQLFLMLERGRVDIIPRGAMSAAYWMDRLRLDANEYEMVHVLKEVDIYLGFSPSTSPELIDRLNQALKRLKKKRADGTSGYDRIVQRHIHGADIHIRQAQRQ